MLKATFIAHLERIYWLVLWVLATSMSIVVFWSFFDAETIINLWIVSLAQYVFSGLMWVFPFVVLVRAIRTPHMSMMHEFNQISDFMLTPVALIIVILGVVEWLLDPTFVGYGPNKESLIQHGTFVMIFPLITVIVPAMFMIGTVKMFRDQ